MKIAISNQILKIFVVVAFYWIISITTVFINKILLGNSVVKLDTPFFITWFQCFITALYYFLYSLLVEDHRSYSAFNFNIIKNVFPLALIFASMIIFNNLCLKNVDVSFYYVGRSLTTVFNVILTFVVLHEKTSFKVCYCCLFIIFGFWLGVDQEKFIGTFSLQGTVYGVLASLSVAYYSIRVKAILPKVDSIVWILSYYINIYSCIIFLPLIIASGEFNIILYNDEIVNGYTWLLLIVSGLCGLTIGYATTLQIKVTSPLTHNISGTAKACAQTIIASYFYNENKPWLWWLSNWIVLIGSAAYTRIKQLEMDRKTLLIK